MPWHQFVAQGLQHGCSDLVASADHFRRAVADRLPGAQPSAGPAGLDPAAAFFGGAPSAPAAHRGASSRAPLAAAPAAVTKEDVGRATWLLLHTLAAQYPDRPSRQQQRDARALMDVLTRLYPCGECARHFAEVVRAHPPAVGGRRDFSQWLCRVHNVVNRALGKPAFNCDYVEARWAGLDCGEEDACTLDALGRGRAKR